MKKNILIILGFALTLSGCNKFLDEIPDNRTEINTVSKVAKVLTGAYPKSTYVPMLYPRCDYIADKGPYVGNVEAAYNTDSFFWNDINSTAQDSPEYYWGRNYYGIAQVNHALSAAQELGMPKEAKPYIAEGKVIRAFNHFLLVTIFSKFYDENGDNGSMGIPYVTECEDVVIKQYDRETVKDTWAKIETDLEEGIRDLGVNSSYAVPSYHFTRAAAHAFAARFYLYKGDMAKVIEHSSAVIPVPVKFTAENNVAADDPASVFATQNFQPWIGTYEKYPSSTDIKLGFNSSSNGSNLLITEMISYLAAYINSWRYGTDEKVTSSTFNANPTVTGGQWAYKVMFISAGNNYYVPQFYSKFVKQSLDATTGNYYSFFPFFRVEEALLNRAEAYARTGQYDKAIADMNVFCRQRSKVASMSPFRYDQVLLNLTTDKIQAFYTEMVSQPNHFMTEYNAFGSAAWSVEQKCIVQCILDLRKLEFMYEGLRYWDLIRYKQSVTHKTFDGRVNTLLPGDDRWVIQLPEATDMSGLKPNPRTNVGTIWNP